MSTSRAAILARARTEGRRAGLKHRLRGTVPVPPASITDGSLLMRQVASEWHRGLSEGRRAAGGNVSLANDGRALELSGTGYPSGVVGSRSGMISLDLPGGTIKPVPGGVTDHHVTVVFLGDDVDDEAFAAACERARQAAASVPGPLPAVIGGIGAFPPSGSSDGKRPVFAKAKIRGGQALRSQLEDLSASEHPDWKPHVTLAYAGKDDPLPAPVAPVPVRFTHLSVHRGEDVRRFPFGG